MRLSVTVYPPGNHTMVPVSLADPQGRAQGGGVRGVLTPPFELQIFKISKGTPIFFKILPLDPPPLLTESCARPWIPTGASPSPCRTVYSLDTWYISRRTRVTFQLELKVTRARVGWKNGRHPVGVPCGTAKNGQRQPGNCPGKPHLWNVTKAWASATSHVSSHSHISKRYALYFNLLTA